MVNIESINKTRLVAGLPSIHHVWCKICRKLNEHFWWNCPNIRCNFCNQKHSTSTCPYKYVCQWCGSTDHISAACNSTNGVALKATCRRRCFRCGRFGHIAVNCISNKVVFLKRRGRFRRKRRRRRRK